MIPECIDNLDELKVLAASVSSILDEDGDTLPCLIQARVLLAIVKVRDDMADVYRLIEDAANSSNMEGG